MARAFLTTVLVVLITAISPGPAAAGSNDDDIGHLQAKIRELVDNAAALEQAGRHEEAGNLLRKADELGRKLDEMTRREGGGPEGVSRDEAKKLLGDLERGMGALKRLGKMEEAEQVFQVYKALAAKLKETEQRDRKPVEGRKPMGREGFGAQLEVLRLARHGLLEAEKKDLAGRLEQAIHAHELLLEGAGHEHAGVRRAPRGGEMVELLSVAAQAWRKFGQPEKAERIEKLAREYGGPGKAEERRADHGEMTPKDRDRDREPDRRADEAMERLDRLQARLEEMQRGMEKILREMEAIRREVR